MVHLMMQTTNAALHDAYAAAYDAQVAAYDCHVADLLFGLCYEFTRPGQRLLDAGIGSGLSAQPFARAGLRVSGMDFSPAMLEICQAKGFAAELRQHDLLEIPWPYPAGGFDHVVCCGVMHFIADLEGIVGEARRALAEGGVFGFTTRLPSSTEDGQPYERQVVGGFEIFSHAPAHVDVLLAQHAFTRRKVQRCFVGNDLHLLWVAGGVSEGSRSSGA
jgi:predicted TPR repeat methyltransferase